MSRRSIAAIVTSILIAGSCAPATLPSGPRTVPPPTTTAPTTTAPTTAPTSPTATPPPTPTATSRPTLTPSPASPTPAASATTAPTGAASGWAAAGSMVTPRVTGQTFLLPDGRVLAVGNDQGERVRDDSATAEVWDPTTSSWTATATLNRPRGWFGGAVLADGRVLVAGGRNQGTPVAGAPPELACGGEDPASFSSAYLSGFGRDGVDQDGTAVRRAHGPGDRAAARRARAGRGRLLLHGVPGGKHRHRRAGAPRRPRRCRGPADRRGPAADRLLVGDRGALRSGERDVVGHRLDELRALGRSRGDPVGRPRPRRRRRGSSLPHRRQPWRRLCHCRDLRPGHRPVLP